MDVTFNGLGISWAYEQFSAKNDDLDWIGA
jgi:hypothetical protein